MAAAAAGCSVLLQAVCAHPDAPGYPQCPAQGNRDTHQSAHTKIPCILAAVMYACSWATARSCNKAAQRCSVRSMHARTATCMAPRGATHDVWAMRNCPLHTNHDNQHAASCGIRQLKSAEQAAAATHHNALVRCSCGSAWPTCLQNWHTTACLRASQHDASRCAL